MWASNIIGKWIGILREEPVYVNMRNLVHGSRRANTFGSILEGVVCFHVSYLVLLPFRRANIVWENQISCK